MSNDDKSRLVGRAFYISVAGGGLAYAYAYNASSNSNGDFGSRLAFKSEELAEYAGNQFIEIFADFMLGLELKK